MDGKSEERREEAVKSLDPIIGLEVEEARAWAKTQGYTVRFVSIDGRRLPGSGGMHCPGRLLLEVEGGVVSKVRVG